MCNVTQGKINWAMRKDGALTRNAGSFSAPFRLKMLILVLSLAPVCSVRADDVKNPYPAMAPVARYMMDKTAEIVFARTAAPKSISDAATILTLGKDGYETAVRGSNDFTCFVERSWANDFNVPDFWDPRDRTPQCWNGPAVSSVLPEYLKRTQWVLASISKDEMQARTKQAWVSHEFQLPAPGSVAYMMSKDQYIHPPSQGVEPHWYPHVMFFVSTADAQKWGDNHPGVPVFSAASNVDPITTFFIVVPKWSDGTLGPYIPTPAAATSAATPETHRHR